MSRREDNSILWVVLGMIGLVGVFTVAFYGTIAAIAIHFIHKFW